MGGRDALHGAVFGDGAAGDHCAFGGEGPGEGIVGEGLAAIFAGDERGELGAQGGGREIGGGVAAPAGGEQRAQPEGAARGIDAGAGDHAADRAFVQVEGGGDIGHRHGQEAGSAMIKRGLLSAQDFLADAQQGGIARLDQPEQGAGGALTFATARCDGNAGQGGAVQGDGPAQIAPAGDEIGFADRGGEGVELCAGFGVHRPDRADGLSDVRFGCVELAG